MKYLSLFVLLIFTLLLIAGCMSAQKASNYLERKGKLAGVCAKSYPVQDRIVIKETIKRDTINQPGPVVKDTCNGKVIEMHCPPSQTIKETIVKDTTIYRRDRAYEQMQSDSIRKLQLLNTKQEELVKGLKEQLKVQEQICKELKQEKRDWQWKAWLTWIGVAGTILITIFWRAKK